MRTAASKMRVSNSSHVSAFFCKIMSSTNATNKNLKHQRRGRFKQLCLCSHSELDTYSCELFSQNDRHCHPQQYSPFLLTHSVCIIVNSSAAFIFYLTVNTVKLLKKSFVPVPCNSTSLSLSVPFSTLILNLSLLKGCPSTT